MKSVWRRVATVNCLDCDSETLLANFGLRQVGLFNRSGFVAHVCGKCLRSYPDETVDVKGWMATNLDEAVRPSDELVWGRRVSRTTKAHT